MKMMILETHQGTHVGGISAPKLPPALSSLAAPPSSCTVTGPPLPLVPVGLMGGPPAPPLPDAPALLGLWTLKRCCSWYASRCLAVMPAPPPSCIVGMGTGKGVLGCVKPAPRPANPPDEAEDGPRETFCAPYAGYPLSDVAACECGYCAISGECCAVDATPGV